MALKGCRYVMSCATTLALLSYPLLMIHAGIGDIRTMQIPNNLVLLLFAGYAAAALMLPLSPVDVALSATAAAVVFALGLVAFSFRWMGGGDVKLLTVAALWLGAGNVVPFILYTSIFGAVLTMLILLFRAVRLPAAMEARDWILRLHQRDAGVPYGMAIAAAGILAYSKTPWVVAQF
ncbi:prepilin peptidase [Paracoccus sp. S-4012]|uniref:A24 family peptidase n=1 Tax=Paracoccus sp. S-4012 TaxID=2665648 RepID=UPI0018A2296D|nr:prepilin peptidase [Paracoccus sp. S-4012]